MRKARTLPCSHTLQTGGTSTLHLNGPLPHRDVQHEGGGGADPKRPIGIARLVGDVLGLQARRAIPGAPPPPGAMVSRATGSGSGERASPRQSASAALRLLRTAEGRVGPATAPAPDSVFHLHPARALSLDSGPALRLR
ncbi:hypothetical protein chiPu_0027815 [Chiloscyllium punctatum]|uniref:Uncharacterized protein n=1 Tax=Chiloscyllium punctatum TaxID=137246 RepID=A0A401TML9_CHIPU|nr:hypothetical protein [Chiloscyllium punctatum]